MADTTTVLKDPTDPRLKNDPGMKLYRSLLTKYAKGANVDDVYHVYGMAVGYETVGLLRRLGANPTRTGLMKAARSISDPRNPFLLPGVVVKTGKGDDFPGGAPVDAVYYPRYPENPLRLKLQDARGTTP